MNKKILGDLKEIFHDIVETVREPLLVLDSELRIIFANRSFYRFFKVTSKETSGQHLYDLGNRQWNIPKLRELLERILPEKESVEDFEVEHSFQTIGTKIMLLNARQIYLKKYASRLILLAIIDATDRIEAEREKERLIADLQKAFDEIKTLRGIIPICASCKKIRDDKGFWNQVEVYVSDHTEADFSHGLCPACAKKLYPDIFHDKE
jgi:PAS domain S-box-containing protein